MKKVNLFLVLLAIVIGGLIFLTQNVHSESAAPKPKTLYTCGMHPQVIQDHPGNCPICGMKLTPVRPDAEGVGASAGSSAISIDPVTIQNMNLRTTEVTRGPLRKTIRTVGSIDYNETALADVTTKFKGWIEKLDVDATGELVHRGEPLFEVYSPDLYSAEVEYLLALNQGTTNGSDDALLRGTAEDKLRFYGIGDAQISELKKSRKASRTIPILAPADGFVMEKTVVQGQMVDAGMKLYRLADLGIVWVIAEVYEQDLPYVRLGQEAVVHLSSMPDREFRGRVTFIYPNVDEKTRTARVRMEFENPGYFLKPGMFVSVQLNAELAPSAVLIPDSAILRSGEKNTVFVALPGGKFEARTVTLGPAAQGDFYQVLSGVNEGDRIVTSGQFMLDSESQLREAIEKMQSGKNLAAEAAPRTNGVIRSLSQSGTSESNATPETVVYVCPMPEHVSIVYNHPGKCPICGMSLVPVAPAQLGKLSPGGEVLYYTCPMPEHSSVHEDKPGKCPLCGMTLIPVMESPKLQLQPASTNSSETKPKQLYTCLMHPEVISDHPGNCPKCGMELVPIEDKPK